MENDLNKLNVLKRLLTEKSFKYSDTPVFALVSGRISRFYIDCKMTTLYSKGSALIGAILYERVMPLRIAGIGGLTLGADPIANAVAVVAGQHDVDLVAFSVRKEVKKHGLKKWIEGGVNKGDRVVILDDVITTGGSTIFAIDKAEEFGLDIVKVIVLVDREEGGRENILKKGYDVDAVFTKTDLMEAYENLLERQPRH